MPLGMFELTGARPVDRSLSPAAGETLLLYSDGVAEARDGNGEFPAARGPRPHRTPPLRRVRTLRRRTPRRRPAHRRHHRPGRPPRKHPLNQEGRLPFAPGPAESQDGWYRAKMALCGPARTRLRSSPVPPDPEGRLPSWTPCSAVRCSTSCASPGRTPPSPW
ncbi:SpoIIE family protein phosphatase [Streptomyces sp. NPDC057027]|uniref:SpoIIE family protein phosphatase n=1 Tax=Streptomyces sp. NPDC057027 TaxID=3346004 RepID=UPI003643FFBF